MSDYFDSVIETEEDNYTSSNEEENVLNNFEEEEQDEIIFHILKDIINYKNENCINICEYIDNINLEKFINEI